MHGVRCLRPQVSNPFQLARVKDLSRLREVLVSIDKKPVRLSFTSDMREAEWLRKEIRE